MFLYVIGAIDQGPVKLGISAHPERRLKQLQTGHSHRLQVYHTEPVPPERARLYEQLLHRDIGYRRTHGEWFDLTVEQAVAQVQFTLIQYEAIDDLAKVRKQRMPDEYHRR